MPAIALNIPASNGTGTPSDVSALDPDKTFIVGGTFGEGETLVIEGTADPTGATGYNGIAAFTSPTQGLAMNPNTPTAPPATLTIGTPVTCVVAWMRTRRVSGLMIVGAAPTVIVNADSLATKNFAAFVVPSGNGVGTALAVNAFGPFIQFTIEGTFSASEVITVEGSEDGTTYNTIAAFNTGKPSLTILRGKYLFMQVRRRGS